MFKAVVDGEIRYGIVPFENSYTGEVGEVLDLLIKYPVYVCKDYDLKISQNLLGILEQNWKISVRYIQKIRQSINRNNF